MYNISIKQKIYRWGNNMENYAIEMLNITKTFSGVKANDNITLQLKKGEIPSSDG